MTFRAILLGQILAILIACQVGELEVRIGDPVWEFAAWAYFRDTLPVRHFEFLVTRQGQMRVYSGCIAGERSFLNVSVWDGHVSAVAWDLRDPYRVRAWPLIET